MKKILSLFQRNHEGDRLVRNEVVPGAEWVVAGEGVATRKFDGSACMVRDGKLYKRYDAKAGRTPPEGWESCEPERDPHTGHWPGWAPVIRDLPENKWLQAAWELELRQISNNPFRTVGFPPDGTYEACGPHFQAGAEAHDPQFRFGNQVYDLLIPHGRDVLEDCPRDFGSLKLYLAVRDIEGIVWHYRPDGRMVKIKTRDFGLRRQQK